MALKVGGGGRGVGRRGIVGGWRGLEEGEREEVVGSIDGSLDALWFVMQWFFVKFGNEGKLVAGRQTYQLTDKPKDHLIEMNEPHSEILKIFSVIKIN